MALIEHYVPLKQVHVLLATASVLLFAARGFGVLAQARWPMRAAVRRISVAIDTALIGAGSTLWWMLSLHPMRDTWLGVKLALIVLYIVLGSLALKRAPTRAQRAWAFGASLTCIGAVALIALTRGDIDLAPSSTPQGGLDSTIDLDRSRSSARPSLRPEDRSRRGRQPPSAAHAHPDGQRGPSGQSDLGRTTTA